MNSTTPMKENTVMRGESGTIQIVMHQTLLTAVPSVLNVPMKDMLPFIGRNNHPWQSIFKFKEEVQIYCFSLIKKQDQTTLRVVCECTLQLECRLHRVDGQGSRKR